MVRYCTDQVHGTLCPCLTAHRLFFNARQQPTDSHHSVHTPAQVKKEAGAATAGPQRPSFFPFLSAPPLKSQDTKQAPAPATPVTKQPLSQASEGAASPAKTSTPSPEASGESRKVTPGSKQPEASEKKKEQTEGGRKDENKEKPKVTEAASKPAAAEKKEVKAAAASGTDGGTGAAVSSSEYPALKGVPPAPGSSAASPFQSGTCRVSPCTHLPSVCVLNNVLVCCTGCPC